LSPKPSAGVWPCTRANGGAAKLSNKQEEDLDAGQDGGGVSGEGDVDLMPQAEHEAVGGQQPGPKQQRSLLARPQRGELVGSGQGAIGMMEDVGDGEVVGKGGVDQGDGRAGDGKKAADAGPPGGFRQPVRGHPAAGSGGQLPQRDSAGHQCVAAQNKSKEERKTSKFRHEKVTNPSRLSQRQTGNGNGGTGIASTPTRHRVNLINFFWGGRH
jgi:hypothetical protein